MPTALTKRISHEECRSADQEALKKLHQLDIVSKEYGGSIMEAIEATTPVARDCKRAVKIQNGMGPARRMHRCLYASPRHRACPTSPFQTGALPKPWRALALVSMHLLTTLQFFWADTNMLKAPPALGLLLRPDVRRHWKMSTTFGTCMQSLWCGFCFHADWASRLHLLYLRGVHCSIHPCSVFAGSQVAQGSMTGLTDPESPHPWPRM